MGYLKWSEADSIGVAEAQIHTYLQGLVCKRGRGWRYSAGWNGDSAHGVARNEAEAKELVESHLKTCTLPDFLVESVSVANFDFNFSLSEIARTAPGTKAAVEALQLAIEHRAGLVTLVGVPGSGKTHMLGTALYAVCRDFLLTESAATDDGLLSNYVKYGLMTALIDEMRSMYSAEDFGTTFSRAWQKLIDLPVLLLDEIDKWPRSEWSRSRMHELIDHRYRGRYKLLTIMAANSLQPLTQPVLSRLQAMGSVLIKLPSADMRRKRARV